MTWILTGLALLSGFAVALSLLLVCLAVILVDVRKTSERHAEKELRLLHFELASARRAAEAAQDELDKHAKAIEAGSLPWFPRNDKLEARYENEAIDKLENPGLYADVVDGLGR